MKCSREYVLKSVADAVYPCDFLPVLYQTVKIQYGTKKRRFYFKRAYVLLRNCGPAIVQLCQRNLTVANPKSPQRPVRYHIIYTFAFLQLMCLRWMKIIF